MKLLVIFLFLLLSACSTSSIKDEVEREVAELSKVNTSDEMMKMSYQMIEENENFSKERREAFSELKARVHSEVQVINRDIAKYKIVLFRTLLDETNRDQKIRYVTHRLRDLHDSKLDIMIDAFFDTKVILGPELLEPMLHERFHEMFFQEYAGGRAGH